MCIPKFFTVLTLAGVLQLGIGFAQTATNGPLFRVTFSASCQGFDATKNRVVTTRITDRTIVAQATGTSASGGGNTRDFALVYNPTEDSLQVANANGEPVVDVVHFGGGTATGDARQTLRLTFMFFPGQTNEFGAETNVFGTAVITERASHTSGSAAATRVNITGKLQFTLLSGTPLGATSIESGTNVQICTGAFSTGPQFPSGTTGGGVAGGTTGTTGTNGVSGGTGTNGVAGTTGTTTNGVTGTNGTTTTTPVVIVTTPTITIPNTTGTTITTFGSTTGMLPSLTGNGSLPGLGTTVGTGTVSLTPFNAITPVTLGTPVTTVNVGTPIVSTTTTTTTANPTTTPVITTTGAGTTTGTATGTLTSSGSITGF